MAKKQDKPKAPKASRKRMSKRSTTSAAKQPQEVASQQDSPTPEELDPEGFDKAWCEERQRRYASYYDPGPGPDANEARTNLWRFLQAVCGLVHGLEAYENIGMPWPMGNCPDAAVPRLPSQTMENALENYRTLVTCHQDAGDLMDPLPASEELRKIAVVLSIMGWELPGSTIEWTAEEIAKDSGEEAGIEIIREAVHRAHAKGAEDLKRLIAEYEICSDTGEREPPPPVKKQGEDDGRAGIRVVGGLILCRGEQIDADPSVQSGSTQDDPPMEDLELEILSILDSKETLTKNDAIRKDLASNAIHRSLTTVKKCVRSLLEKHMVERPKERGGVRITPLGRAKVAL